MFKRLALLAVATLLIISFVAALQVSDIQESLNQNSTELTTFKAETKAQLTEIDQKLDKYLTKDEMLNYLGLHLIKMQEVLDYFRSLLIVSFILIAGASIGIAYGIYFYFKGRGRV